MFIHETNTNSIFRFFLVSLMPANCRRISFAERVVFGKVEFVLSLLESAVHVLAFVFVMVFFALRQHHQVAGFDWDKEEFNTKHNHGREYQQTNGRLPLPHVTPG